MNLKEAHTTLNLSPAATPEEVKKQYRKLTREFHPDVNKSSDAEAKFKKINEAYDVIQKGKDSDADVAWNPFGGGHNPFNPFGSRRQSLVPNVDLHTTISFKDAVQGCKVDLKYIRSIKCASCNGNGEKTVSNGCRTCGGRGNSVQRQGWAVSITQCVDCLGRTSTTPCEECHHTGVLEAESSITVSIPPAISDGNVLRLQGIGHYSSSIMGIADTYTDAHLHVQVIPEPGLRVENGNIVSELNISLLSAFQGCQKTITTIDGQKEVQVPSLIKNREELKIMVGDKKNIIHRIIVQVDYPTNIDQLIGVLSKEEK